MYQYDSDMNESGFMQPADMDYLAPIDPRNNRYPACIVWTPIPFLTWFFPFIGHMGICSSAGIIRDFAGPYVVSTDNMAFGLPTRYLQFDPKTLDGGCHTWDAKVAEASEIYKSRMHNLFCDNCHSHVAMALNLMKYDGGGWNMFRLATQIFVFGRYVGLSGVLKTWMPFLVVATFIIVLVCLT